MQIVAWVGLYLYPLPCTYLLCYIIMLPSHCRLGWFPLLHYACAQCCFVWYIQLTLYLIMLQVGLVPFTALCMCTMLLCVVCSTGPLPGHVAGWVVPFTAVCIMHVHNAALCVRYCSYIQLTLYLVMLHSCVVPCTALCMCTMLICVVCSYRTFTWSCCRLGGSLYCSMHYACAQCCFVC